MKSKRNLILLSCILLAGTLSTTAKAKMSLEEMEKELNATNTRLDKVEEKASIFDDLEFQGYARSGIIITDYRTDGHKLSIPGTDFGGYRLGNEDDTGWELETIKTFKMEDGSYAKFHLRLTNFIDDAYDESVGDTVNAEQVFAEMGNLPTFTGAFADSVIWAGKRYYERDGFYINDWKYTNMSGTGGGVTNINVGPGNLNLAFIANDLEDENIKVYNLDARYKGIEAFDGTFEYNITLKQAKNSTGTDDGFQLGAMYDREDFYGVAKGTTKVVLQYGDGLGARLGYADSTEDFTSDSSAYRLATDGLANLNEKWDVFAQGIIEKRKSYGSADYGDDQTWISVGTRPVYKINKNFELQYELGYDYVNYESLDVSGYLTKFTFAPTFKLDTEDFWARPEIRVFVTYAVWDNDLNDVEEIGDSATADNGLNFGVQAEVWF